ncbi:hypothetical protein VTP01DRAFT_2862 [Rhizomucor pusillus]|uniref:uncharacterized protein n=1 Tax=Rhizomucor pusillus TaxID=4840 RepID=UPI00374487BF
MSTQDKTLMSLFAGARISAKPHFLNSTPIAEALRTVVALEGPAIKLMDNIVAGSSLIACAPRSVKLDQLPDQPVSLFGTSLRFKGACPAARSASRSVTSRQATVQDWTSDLMEDVLLVPAEFDSGELIKAIMRRRKWTFAGGTRAKEYASAAQYFLRFIPEAHIQEVVLPTINEHAASSNRVEDHDIYWHRGEFPNLLTINFGDYMTIERFKFITKYQEDPLYQIRGFLWAYNANLQDALTPGRYLSVDESMNQWLGKGKPNIKNFPRKPHVLTGVQDGRRHDHLLYHLARFQRR